MHLCFNQRQTYCRICPKHNMKLLAFCQRLVLHWDDDVHDFVFIKNFNTTSTSHPFRSHPTLIPKKVIPRDLCPDDGCHCLLCLIHVGLPILNFYNGWGMLVTVSGTFVCWSSDSGCILWWRLANQMCHASSCKKYQPNQHVRWNSMQIDNLHIHILIFTNHICS